MLTVFGYLYEHKMNVLFSDDEREENLDALLPSKN